MNAFVTILLILAILTHECSSIFKRLKTQFKTECVKMTLIKTNTSVKFFIKSEFIIS